MHLGHAAQAVGILHPVAAGVAAGDGAVGEQRAQVGRAFELARMRARPLDALIEGGGRAAVPFEAGRPRDVGDPG